MTNKQRKTLKAYEREALVNHPVKFAKIEGITELSTVRIRNGRVERIPVKSQSDQNVANTDKEEVVELATEVETKEVSVEEIISEVETNGN